MLFVFLLFLLTVVLAFNPWLDGLVKIAGTFIPAILIFNYWRTKSEANAWMLLLAGVMLGQALTSAMDHLPPLDDAAMLWVYQWWPWPIVGIVGFAAFVTAIALPWDDQWFRK